MKAFRIFTFVSVLIISQLLIGEEKIELLELVAARKNYEKEFVYKIKPLQRKYRQALEKYRITFTRSGDLGSAKESSIELQSVLEWTNIAARMGEREMKNQQLNSLLQSFEKAVSKEVAPITQRYRTVLLQIKKRYENSANLKNALLLDEELVKITNSLPTEAGKIEFLTGLDKRDFEQWLQRQAFDFSGAFSGFTLLKFKNNRMSYF